MSELLEKLKSIGQVQRFMSNRVARHVTQVRGPLGLYDPVQAQELDDDVPPLALDDLFKEERGAKNFDWLNVYDSSLTGGVPTDWWLDSTYRSEQVDGGLDPEIVKYVVGQLHRHLPDRPLTPEEQAIKARVIETELDAEALEAQFVSELIEIMTIR